MTPIESVVERIKMPHTQPTMTAKSLEAKEIKSKNFETMQEKSILKPNPSGQDGLRYPEGSLEQGKVTSNSKAIGTHLDVEI